MMTQKFRDALRTALAEKLESEMADAIARPRWVRVVRDPPADPRLPPLTYVEGV